MKLYLLIAILFLCVQLHAQTPPAQLPSLLDGTTIQMPIIPSNEDPLDFIRKNVFVKVWANKTKAYEGEPILVTYKLYTSLNTEARVNKQPVFNACSVTELSAEHEPHEATVNGKLFNVFVIRRVQIIPLQQGTLELGQALVDNIIQLMHNNGSSIENFSITVQNDPLKIDVKPLPAEGRPSNFSGLVGNYSIAANIDTDKLPAGEDALLHLTISGSGDIVGVHLPPIQWPLGTEHFEGTDSQHIDLENFPVSGYKTFKIPFIGDREGNAVIPPVSFSYFDPVAQTYKTISTASLPVSFTKPVSRQEEMKNIITDDITNRKYLWIVAAIGVAVITFWLVGSKSRSKQKNNVQKIIQQQEPVESKKEPVKKAIDSSLVFAELNDLGNINISQNFFSSTRYFLIKTLQIKLEASVLSEHDLVIMMKQKDEYTDIACSCENIFDTCNRNLYSPLIDEDIREKVYFELTAIVKKMYEFN